MPKLKLPLRSVLVWSFVLLIVITGTATSYLSLRDRQIAVNQLAAAWHGEITTRVVRFLDANLAKPRLITQIAIDDQQAGFWQMGDLDAIDRYLLKRLQAIDFITALLYGDQQNNFRAASRLDVLQMASDPREPQKIHSEINAEGRSIQSSMFHQSSATDRPWYRAAATAGKPTWSQILGSDADSLNFTVPIYDRQSTLR